jgi:hypothetical protein
LAITFSGPSAYRCWRAHRITAPPSLVGSCDAEHPLERRTFHVTSGGALRRMEQPVPEGDEFPDCSIEFTRFGSQFRAIDPRTAVRTEHGAYLVERETCVSSKRDERQPLKHTEVEYPTNPLPSD